MYVVNRSIRSNEPPSQSVWVMNFILEISYHSINAIPLDLILGLLYQYLL